MQRVTAEQRSRRFCFILDPYHEATSTLIMSYIVLVSCLSYPPRSIVRMQAQGMGWSLSYGGDVLVFSRPRTTVEKAPDQRPDFLQMKYYTSLSRLS